MELTEKKAAGTLKISRSVVASIAEAAAKEIPGVYALSGSIYSIMRPQTLHGAYVAVNDGLAQIRLRLVLESDARIQDTSVRVQQAVKEAVQNMTGITVSKVNIVIAGIHYTAESEEK